MGLMRHSGYFITFCRLPKIGSAFVAHGPRGIFKIGMGVGKKQFIKSLPRKISWNEKTGVKTNKLPNGRIDLSSGTSFQRKVWRAICKIPRGETRSYKWLAKKAGRPKAVRAVANACGANPIPIIIPCHRVIRSDGTLGGFSGPRGLKKKLLRIEEV